MKGLYLSFNVPQCHMHDDIILSLMDARSSGEVGIHRMRIEQSREQVPTRDRECE